MSDKIEVINQAMAALRLAETLLGEYKELVDVVAPSDAVVKSEGAVELSVVSNNPPAEEPAPIDVPEHDAAPAATVEVQYAPAEKLGDHTIQQFLDLGWTYEQLVAEGYVVQVEVEVEEPDQGSAHKMTAKANGARYEQFIEGGWTHEQLVENGYLEDTKQEKFVPPPVPKEIPKPDGEVAEWPRRTLDGVGWMDSAQAVWKASEHADNPAHKSNPETSAPPVKKDGTFKAAKKKKAAPEAPAKKVAPNIPPSRGLTGSTPVPPPAVEVVGGTDEAIDPELAALVTQFNS